MAHIKGEGSAPAGIQPESVRCARCQRPVGLVWFRGRSTLFEGPIETDGQGNLLIRRHSCEPDPKPPAEADRKPLGGNRNGKRSRR